ncbi:MAG TPA: hypothetical protein VGK13_03730 [Methanocellaceae archaeon]
MSKIKKFLTICTASVASALVALPSHAWFGPFGLGFGGLGLGFGFPFGLGFGGFGFSSFSSLAFSSMFNSFGFGFNPFFW